MHNPILAKRYADALLELAIEENKLDELNDDIEVMRSIFQQNDELIELLNSPRITKSQKRTMIETSFKGIAQNSVHMVLLLVSRQRTELIIPMFDVLINRIADQKGIAYLDVFTTQALSEAQKKSVTEIFKKRLNKTTIVINEKIDSSIIGGLKIRYNNTVYDGTVKNSLNQLKSKIKTASN